MPLRMELNIRLLAAPLYVMMITTRDKAQGLDLAMASLNRIAEEIKYTGEVTC